MNIRIERQLAGDLGPLARSLCATCFAAPTCGHRARSQPVVWFCEDFELEAIPHEPALAAPTHPRVDPPPVESARFGLCTNCEDRLSCELPTPEGGVWHCEEYQ